MGGTRRAKIEGQPQTAAAKLAVLSTLHPSYRDEREILLSESNSCKLGVTLIESLVPKERVLAQH